MTVDAPVDLDTRMRAASASLRRASERLAPEGPPPGRSRLVAALAAVTVLLVAAAGVVTLLRGGDETADVSTDRSVVPRFVADEVPEGMAPTGAVDLPLPDELAGVLVTTVSVYGDPQADDPFAEADLGIFVRDASAIGSGPNTASGEVLSPSDGSDQVGDAVTVRGHPGTVEASSLGLTLGWEEAPGLHVQLASSTLDRGQLLSVAEELVVDGTEVRLGAAPPGVTSPLAPIGTTSLVPGLAPGAAPGVAPGVAPTLVPSTGEGHVVGYQSDDGARSAVVTALEGDASDIAVARWVGGAHERVAVRERAGWSGATEPETRALVWEEAPGLLVWVQGFGIGGGDVHAIAESLRPATGTEWDALLAETGSDDDSGDGDVSADDSLADLSVPDGAVVRLLEEYPGGVWVVYEDTDGSLCGEILSDGATAGACGEAGAALVTLHGSEGSDASTGLVLLFGVMPPGAVDMADDQLHQGVDMALDTTGDRSYYGLILEADDVPANVTFVDQGGEIVATVAASP
jgi:hypothetical protein